MPIVSLAGILVSSERSICEFSTRSDSSALNLSSDFDVLWYRRPVMQHAPVGAPTEDVIELINDETAALISNFYAVSEIPRVNCPIVGRFASHKALQLKIAVACGLDVPRTYFGNDSRRVRELFNDCDGRLVLKPFRAVSLRAGDGDDERTLYTSRVFESDLLEDKVVSACPSIWQERIDKLFEIRVTIVGDKLFAAELDSQLHGASFDDWRRGVLSDIPHRVHLLPSDVAERCVRLMNCFGLNFAAIDLVLATNGKYYFLENNPFGQWAWIQDLCGLPIAEAHCDLFRSLATKPRNRVQWVGAVAGQGDTLSS